MRLYGVGGAFSTMLNAAGVHSCRELQNCEPEQLYAALETVHSDKKLGHHIPTLTLVTEWIIEAKTLAATSPE
jgi:nucleotidyltransferase/DNA polymerase involved in DNA repair